MTVRMLDLRSGLSTSVYPYQERNQVARFLRLMSILSLLVAATAACSPFPEDAAELQLIYGLTIDVSGLDPHINQSAELGIVLRQVYDTLVYRDPVTLDFVPGLAREWQLSEDGLTYIFSLRVDVSFHDGTPMDAHAIVRNFERVLDPATNSQKARFLLGPVESFVAVDDRTFVITLSEPFAPLLDSLSQVYLGIASPAALDLYDNVRYQFHQVGSGPYRFVEYVPGDYVIIEVNPGYEWGPPFYSTDISKRFHRVIFRFFRDSSTRLAALEQGGADIMGEVSPLDARLLAGNAALKLVPAAVPGQPLQLLMNTVRPSLNDIRVRQALLLGTNRSSIVNLVYQGLSPLAYGPLSRHTEFYSRLVEDKYRFNPEAAKQLLDEAGLVDQDGDGWRESGGEPIRLSIVTPPWGQIPDVVTVLADQWRQIGLQVESLPVPGYTRLVEVVRSGDYDLLAFNVFGLDPIFLNDFFGPDPSLDWTGYEDPNLSSLLVEAARTTDFSTRALLYQQIQLHIMEAALVLPIRDYINLNAHSSGLEGLGFDAYGWFPILPNVVAASP
jgi:peptide/nickel transport system substrate-binding protein